jgi:hypothetical protein
MFQVAHPQSATNLELIFMGERNVPFEWRKIQDHDWLSGVLIAAL